MQALIEQSISAFFLRASLCSKSFHRARELLKNYCVDGKMRGYRAVAILSKL